ncbi:hypothetical protein [Sediminibacillus massiliensis]|uniref:hypothetical protein n=1 Tax=Sediminibacillus massiliensis TaxID=1926277 RepID=UPI0009888F40|nr:hypothetical protein [Sediminibacillus massiliensis]
MESWLLIDLIWIKKAQLNTLGLNDTYLYLMAGFFLMAALFLIVRPIIRLLIMLRWENLMSYMWGSMGVISFVVYFTRKAPGDIPSFYLGIILFGVTLIILKLGMLLYGFVKSRMSIHTNS